jgi:hypothetical protein
MTYHNTEVFKQSGGRKTIRRVTIKNGKGKKSVSYYRRGRHVETVAKPLRPSDIVLILGKKFIPGLFADCDTRKKRYRRK